MPIDPELLDGLTDEERRALEETEGQDDTTTTMEAVYDPALQAQDQGQAQGEEDGDDAAAAAKAAAEASGVDGADAGSAGDGDAGDGDAADAAAKADFGKPAPLLVAEAPADADAKLREISEKKNTLMQQVDDGDITVREYQTQLDALSKEERTIERAVEKAQLAAEMNQQLAVNTWMQQVQDFTTNEHPEYSKSRARWTALDMFVKEIGQKPENANLPGAKILEMAHARVLEDLGEAPASAKPAADASGKKAGQPLKGSQAKPPKTLAAAPAAQPNETGDGRWAELDALLETNPDAHEERLMRMSEAELDAYNNR